MTENHGIQPQLGCGYCRHEKKCPDHNPKTNKAKLGCINFIHHELESAITKGIGFEVKQENVNFEK